MLDLLPSFSTATNKLFSFSSHTIYHRQTWFTSVTNNRRYSNWKMQNCSSLPPPLPVLPLINLPFLLKSDGSTAKIRSEVLSPFRSVRMFFYLAFIARGALGGFIATTQLIAALRNPARAAEVPDTLKSLGIDISAISIFAFLYYRENNAKKAQIARLSREESLSTLKLCVEEKRIISVSSERGLLVVPFATDGNLPSFEFDESEEMKEVTTKRKRLWQLNPTYVSDWSKWLDEQKKLDGVSLESPVYLSLHLDGRVLGSGVGYPPWNAFVEQLPPVKGL